MQPVTNWAERVVDDRVVLDASAMVDLLIGSRIALAIARRLMDQEIHVPAHFDAEVLSALGRLERAGLIDARDATRYVDDCARASFQRHPVGPLMAGAWERRSNLRLADGLYVELAARMDARVLSTDRALAAASTLVETIGAD